MDNDDNKRLVENLALDYSKYFMVDTAKQKKQLDGEIATLSKHLDEYKEVLERVHVENKLVSEKIPRLFIYNPTLQKTFRNIDNVEKMIGAIKEDLGELETSVLRAEKDLGVGPNFSDVIKPLLFKKDPFSFDLVTSTEVPSFVPPNLNFDPNDHISVSRESHS